MQQNSIQELREKYIRALDPDKSFSLKSNEIPDDLFNLDLTMYSGNNSFSSIVYNAFAQSSIDAKISLHPEQIKIIEQIEQNNAIIISAPTSCGKTFCIFEYIAKHKPQNIVLIVPTLALIEEYFKKIIKQYKNKFNSYKIYTNIDENKTYDFNKNNIFILTHDRIVQENSYCKIPQIDFLVIDEVYKLKTNQEDDRVLILNMAYHYLAKKAKKYVLLAPFIGGVTGIDELEKSPVFYKTDYSPVVNNIIERAILNNDVRFEECKKIIEELNDAEKTLIYFPTVKSLYDYIDKILINFPIWTSPPTNIANYLKWAKEEIHEEWCVVKALERGYLIHNGQIPIGTRMFQLDCYGNDATLYNKMLCTSTLLEGVNTTAKNIIITKPSRKSNKQTDSFTAFDFYNLVGRTGRLQKHYVGNAYYIKAPTDPEFIKNDAMVEIQFEINDNSKDIDIQTEDIQKHLDVQIFLKELNITLKEYQKNIGTRARFETVKNLYANYKKNKDNLINCIKNIIENPTTTSRATIISEILCIVYGKTNKLESSLINHLLNKNRLKIKDIINRVLHVYKAMDVNYIISELIKLKNGKIEHEFYNKATIIKYFMSLDKIPKELLKCYEEKIIVPIEYLYFTNSKQEKMLADLGIYERDIVKIIKIIGSDFEDAFDLKQRLSENITRFKNLTYISRYIIEQLI